MKKQYITCTHIIAESGKMCKNRLAVAIGNKIIITNRKRDVTLETKNLYGKITITCDKCGSKIEINKIPTWKATEIEPKTEELKKN